MSPHAVNSLVTDLVQMAQAMQELPKVREQLDEARDDLDTQAATIQRLELKLIDRANEIDTLHASVRDLEVARDDAELRFLELDERAAKAVRFLAQVQGMAVQAELELNPPKSQPTPTIEPVVSEVHAIEPEQTVQHSTDSPALVGAEVVQGQSEPDPITNPLSGSSNSTNGTEQETHSSLEPSPGPYVGLNYFEYRGYVSHNDWIAGGGTNTDYWHRREDQH